MNKVMTEVKAKRYAGCTRNQTYLMNILFSPPLVWVPKDKGKKTRLIFHLSYPKDGNSVNSGIPPKLCKVKYPDFNEAVQMCMDAGRSCAL